MPTEALTGQRGPAVTIGPNASWQGSWEVMEELCGLEAGVNMRAE